MRLLRQQYKGDGKTHETAKWYVEVKDHDGRWRRIPGFTDKGATAELGRQVERLVALRSVKQPPTPGLSAWLEGMPATLSGRLAAWGILDARYVPHAKTLPGASRRFPTALLAKGDTREHATYSRPASAVLTEVAGSFTFSEISASAVQTYLAERRRSWRHRTPRLRPIRQKDQRKNGSVPNVKLLPFGVQAILPLDGSRPSCVAKSRRFPRRAEREIRSQA